MRLLAELLLLPHVLACLKVSLLSVPMFNRPVGMVS